MLRIMIKQFLEVAPPAHTSLLVFLPKNNTVMMPQPSYSQNLASCDFFSFPKIKRTIKGRRYVFIDKKKVHL